MPKYFLILKLKYIYNSKFRELIVGTYLKCKLKTKITYILSNISNAIAFEWIIESLDSSRFTLHFILILNEENSVLENYLIKHHISYSRLIYRGKKDIPILLWKIYRILRREKTKIVHTHLFEACLTGLFTAKLLGIKKRIYTRHHSTFHHTFFPRAVWYDKFINWLATDIIAISAYTKKVLIEMEKTPARKVHLIHHGFKLKNFVDVPNEEINYTREKYGLKETDFVVGVVSRQVNWKGIEYITEAFSKIIKEIPQAKIILANALGDYKPVIEEKLKQLPLGSSTQIEFERNIAALYKCMHVFVHVPIDPYIEAFGQIYVEAMAAGIPCVVTMSGIAHEYIKDGENALVVDYKNSSQIYEAIMRIYLDKELAQKISLNGKEDVFNKFTLKMMIEKLEKLYAS